MAYLDELRNLISREIISLKEKIAANQEIKDNSPAATESKSDTTRHRYEMLLENQKRDLRSLQNFQSLIPKEPPNGNSIALWSKFEAHMSTGSKTFILVPPDFGGKSLGESTLLSSNSPLGQVLKSRSVGDKIEFNNQDVSITRII